MAQPRLSLPALNAAGQNEFAVSLDWVFEGAPAFVAQAWHDRPFASVDDLHRSLCAAMRRASRDEQIALIRAHPDLVGRAALASTLSPASTMEQASAGLDRLTPDEIATFTRLNQQYRETFDFPFIICARENKKASILAGFAARLNHSQAEEIDIALQEIAKIAQFRLLDAAG